MRVLWVGEGNSRGAIRSFFELPGEKGCKAIEAIALDMNTAFDLEVRQHCPQAEDVFQQPDRRGYSSPKNRNNPREDDQYLYPQRHLVENAFLLLKRRRGMATRYAKNLSSFLAAVNIS